MPAKRKPIKKRTRVRKVRTVKEDSLTELDMYCIWLNEYYKCLTKAGFKSDVALTFVIDKQSYPEWVKFRANLTEDEIRKQIEEDEDDD